MSKPVVKSNLHNVVSEIMSAMSALNMFPEPIENPKGEYLSQTDSWAEHSYQHLRAALHSLRDYMEENNV